MNPQGIKIIQTLGELAIPLLGYFFWNWNFYFIALFYLLDLLANTSILIFKLKKLPTFKNDTSKITLHFSLYALSLTVLILVGTLLCQNLIPHFDLKKQTIAFMMLKDMGIAQGFLIIPLVAYTAYLQFKTEYLMPKKYLIATSKTLLKKHHLGLIISLILISISLGVSYLIIIPEMIAVVTLIVLTASYSYFLRR